MPLARISLRRGKSPAYRRAICDAVYPSPRATVATPEDDRFGLVDNYDEADFVDSPSCLGMARSDDGVMADLTVTKTRTRHQNKALYATLADRLGVDPGIARGDVPIILTEVATENWSFGEGRASYA